MARPGEARAMAAGPNRARNSVVLQGRAGTAGTCGLLGGVHEQTLKRQEEQREGDPQASKLSRPRNTRLARRHGPCGPITRARTTATRRTDICRGPDSLLHSAPFILLSILRLQSRPVRRKQHINENKKIANHSLASQENVTAGRPRGVLARRSRRAGSCRAGGSQSTATAMWRGLDQGPRARVITICSSVDYPRYVAYDGAALDRRRPAAGVSPSSFYSVKHIQRAAIWPRGLLHLFWLQRRVERHAGARRCESNLTLHMRADREARAAAHEK